MELPHPAWTLLQTNKAGSQTHELRTCNHQPTPATPLAKEVSEIATKSGWQQGVGGPTSTYPFPPALSKRAHRQQRSNTEDSRRLGRPSHSPHSSPTSSTQSNNFKLCSTISAVLESAHTPTPRTSHSELDCRQTYKLHLLNLSAPTAAWPPRL